MSLENPFEQNVITNTNEEVVETMEQPLTVEEENVVQKNIEVQQAIVEYDKALAPMVARGQGEQLSDIYGEKWKKLAEEAQQMTDSLSPESKNKVWEATNKKLGELDLLPKSQL